jgi:hypothetical protein
MLLRNTSPASKLWASCAKSISSQQMRKATRKLTCVLCVCACFCLQYRDLDNSKTIGTSVPDALRFECLLFAILVLPSGFVAMRLLLFLALQAESAAQQKSCPETLSIVGGTWFQQLVGIDSLLQEVAKEGRHTNITYQRFLWNALRDSDMFQLLWLD